MKWYVKVDHGKRGTAYAHREIWAAVHGPIPPGMIIHHADDNRRNNAIDNLICVTKLEHQRLHLGCAHGQQFRNDWGKCRMCQNAAAARYRARQRSL
jgi:hypothetical protein